MLEVKQINVGGTSYDIVPKNLISSLEGCLLDETGHGSVASPVAKELLGLVKTSHPRNLLDNSDFTNLVAQAGIGGNHGTGAYAADRWILDSGTVSYEAGVGLTLSGTIRQKLEFKPTRETSTFVGMASGTASISYTDGVATITSSGGVLKWAALYEGSYTPETLPEYQPKGYGVELAECQRYYQRFSSGTQTYFVFALGYMQSATSCRFFLPLTVPMRAKPTINSQGAVYFNYGSSSTRVVVSGFSMNNMLPNQVFLSSTTESGVTMGTVGEVMTTTGTGVVIELTADL